MECENVILHLKPGTVATVFSIFLFQVAIPWHLTRNSSRKRRISSHLNMRTSCYQNCKALNIREVNKLYSSLKFSEKLVYNRKLKKKSEDKAPHCHSATKNIEHGHQIYPNTCFEGIYMHKNVYIRENVMQNARA